MSRINLTPMVGNEFVMPRPRLQPAAPSTLPSSPLTLPVKAPATEAEAIPVTVASTRHINFASFIEFVHLHSFITFSLLILLIGATGVEVAGRYMSVHFTNQITSTTSSVTKAPVVAGLNLQVPVDQLQAKIQAITSQPATLTVGDNVTQISPDTLKSWLQITGGSTQAERYIHIKASIINKSLSDLANKYAKAPVDQVTATHDGVSSVIVGGVNGARLTDPGSLNSQANSLAKTVMNANGLQFSTPLETVPFRAVTPAAFNKLIEVNIVTKQMWLYDNGNVTKSYPISAGAPATPTPIGEFHTYAKLTTQDMRGINPNGTPYLQPHVHWISYFLPGGYAIHGNYWRPMNWFGAVNSSHGCVSLPDNEAKEVYDWAPVGTTVITHY